MSRQVSSGSAGEYQADEHAGVALEGFFSFLKATFVFFLNPES